MTEEERGSQFAIMPFLVVVNFNTTFMSSTEKLLRQKVVSERNFILQGFCDFVKTDNLQS